MLKNMRRFLPGLLVLCGVLFGAASGASAIEVKVTPQALERTLKTQLFNGPDGRYYLRGKAGSSCYVYADDPHVTFKDDRVVVHVHTKSKLGTSVHGACIGLTLNSDVDVSLVPDAEGETIGFRDARIEKLSDSHELNFLLMPFLSHKLPQQMKVNAADLMRQLLNRSTEATGYALSLTALKIHSLLVQGALLVLDVDAGMSVS
ncbi:hypothetical protein [Edaphobacter bradus]|uniref:hypothetical protein n=1 Tax=Edaphobacter bradus TaxID=2259016 RepID=UPI0021E069A6|nr:hypothetical protein [Edaphobacter bradus]